MQHKILLLGLPGSGKSTISRYILKYMQRYHDEYSATRICDYDILYQMFKDDPDHKSFYPTPHNGFYVKDPSMYDLALKKLEEIVVNDCDYAEKDLVIIEFARTDYTNAFKNFNPTFLRDAFFLFLDVDIETGMKRVKDRVRNPVCRDNHFVSKFTFEFYRQKDNAKHLSLETLHLMKRYNINPENIKILNNRGPERGFWEIVNNLIKRVAEETPATV